MTAARFGSRPFLSHAMQCSGIDPERCIRQPHGKRLLILLSLLLFESPAIFQTSVLHVRKPYRWVDLIVNALLLRRWRLSNCWPASLSIIRQSIMFPS